MTGAGVAGNAVLLAVGVAGRGVFEVEDTFVLAFGADSASAQRKPRLKLRLLGTHGSRCDDDREPRSLKVKEAPRVTRFVCSALDQSSTHSAMFPPKS